MKKILALALAFICIFSVACRKDDLTADGSPKTIYTYLVAGLDNAAYNTDVLFLLSYDLEENKATVLQIPRDTYCRYKGTEGKINRIFPSLISQGNNRKEAMSALNSYVEGAFGIDTDGYVCFDTDTFRKVVDLVGGIDISLDKELVIYDEHGKECFVLDKGVTHMDGEMSERFVRFRKGYATGDLGRIDAQKLFIDAFIKSVKSNVGIDEAIRIAFTLASELVTDVGPYKALDMLVKNRDKFDDTTFRYVTLPGEATIYNGKSFYVLNRKNTAEILSNTFGSKMISFDEDRIFTSEGVSQFDNIYHDENSGYKIYE